MATAEYALTSALEIDSALRSRRAVFLGLSPMQPIFTSQITRRAILYPCSHKLSTAQFSALSSVMTAAGESEYYMSYVPDVRTNDDSFYQYWRLPSGDLSAYEKAASAPLETALYSVHATWGILITDVEFGVVGGDDRFVQLFFSKLPEDSEMQARRFVEDWYANARIGGWRTDWVESMLPDVVGPDRARELLANQERR